MPKLQNNFKVLHVITTIERGGAENELLVLVRHQVALGNSVTIVYLKGEPELESSFRLVGANIRRLNGSNLAKLIQLKAILARKFDIAHAHLPRSEIFLALANFGSKNPVSLVATRHNAEAFYPNGLSFISRLLSRIVLSRYSSLISISKAVESYLVNSGEVPKGTKRSVIYYGFDDSKEKQLIINEIMEKDKSIFLFVGRLTAQKNIPVLLIAFRKYLESGNHGSLHIYGEGAMEKELKSLAGDIEKHVYWHSKSSDVLRIMKRSSCLILPSRYEGFGLVLLEAMQVELPIIAANNSAIPEVLGEDHPCLYPTDNAEMLSNLLAKIQEPKFRELTLLHQSTRLQLFKPETMTQKIQSKYMEMYNSTLRKPIS